MNHQPFENWIFEEELTSIQEQELEAHLSLCPDCARLKQNLQSVEAFFKAEPLVSPKPGFAQRWQSDFARRKALQQKRMVRRLLLFLGSAALGTLLLLSITLFLSTSPARILSSAFEVVGNIVLQFNALEVFVWNFVRSQPAILTIASWILATSAMAMVVSVWVFSMWRIAAQGVFQK